MASYPTSIKSFASRSAGQTIGSAHINDLQDEVGAIETALFTGPITLQASTLASLSVTGASTFTLRPVTPPPDAALVFLASTGAVGSSALSTLSFLSQAFLTNSSMHSTAVNPDRITPQSTGIYQVSAQVRISGSVSTQSEIIVQVLDSSGNTIAEQTGLTTTLGGATPSAVLGCTGYKRFDALGGYVQCRFVNNTAGSTMSLSSGVSGTWFALVKL